MLYCKVGANNKQDALNVLKKNHLIYVALVVV